MSVTKLGKNAFKLPRRSRRRRRQEKKRFGRLEISPHKTTSCRHRQQKNWGFKCKNPWLCGQLPPKQLGQMQLLFIGGGQEKSYHFFLLLGTPCKQAIANKAAKISDLALLLYAVITYSYMLYSCIYT